MREIVRDCLLSGAAGVIAAVATAVPLAWSLDREGDRLDEADAVVRRELEAIPAEVHRELERFRTAKAALEHKIAVIEELRSGRGDLVGVAQSVLGRLPEETEWVEFALSRRRLGLVVDTRHPLAAVHLGEALGAEPWLDRVQMEALGEGEPDVERFLLSAELADPESHGAE